LEGRWGKGEGKPMRRAFQVAGLATAKQLQRCAVPVKFEDQRQCQTGDLRGLPEPLKSLSLSMIFILASFTMTFVKL